MCLSDIFFILNSCYAVISNSRFGICIYFHFYLKAGDLLLLEAGPTFVKKNGELDSSFSLLAEVENSAPPRLRMLIPALGEYKSFILFPLPY